MERRYDKTLNIDVAVVGRTLRRDLVPLPAIRVDPRGLHDHQADERPGEGDVPSRYPGIAMKDPDERITFDLTDDERWFLCEAIHEWGGASQCTEAMAVAMGFVGVTGIEGASSTGLAGFPAQPDQLIISGIQRGRSFPFLESIDPYHTDDIIISFNNSTQSDISANEILDVHLGPILFL